MPRYIKKDFPVHDVRRFLEPGPIVLVSSAHKDKTNIMTMGWHMVMEFSPALVACLISGGNHSFDLVRRSRQLGGGRGRRCCRRTFSRAMCTRSWSSRGLGGDWVGRTGGAGDMRGGIEGNKPEAYSTGKSVDYGFAFAED